jgi:hypothetical protein
MDFKSLLSQLDQLNEATDRSEPGKVKHSADPGGYGRKDDEDEDGKQVKPASTEKRGKGRPKKATQTSGEDKKYDFSAFGVKAGKDVKLPKYDKKKTTKHSLKEYFDQLESALNEEGYTTAPMPGAVAVKDGTGKVVATAKNPQAAAAFQKGDITLGGEEMQEGDIGKHNNATTGFDALVRKLTPKYGKEAATKIAGAQMKKIKEAEMPTHDGDMGAGLGAGRSQQFEAKKPDANKNGIPDYAEDGKGKNDLKKKKVKEDMDSESKTDKSKLPSMAHIKKMCKDGKSVAEICKMHPDCDQKELKQMIADCKKKMVKEGMNENLLIAKLKGKHDGMKGHSHCGKTYDDMEEARHYHEGYKEGLDECYGQMPIRGLVGEMGSEVENMASYGARTPAMEDDMYEMDKTSYMKQQAIKSPGDKFKAFGQTFNDSDVLDEFAFEALDNQLNALLESKEDVAEGMTVSISKGQQGAPDSVSVSAQDGEADQLLSIIKSAGLGLFGGEETNGYGAPQGSTQAPGGIEVVDDHDGMMALMKKLAGGGEEVSGGDYESEEGHSDEHGREETCESCGGMMEADHSCGSKEMVDEVESEDQQLYNVAEDNPPDSGADNTNADVAGQVGSDAALAKADAGQDEEEGKIYSSPTNEAELTPAEKDEFDKKHPANIPFPGYKGKVKEAEDETGEEAGKEEMKERMSESSFFNLYKKLSMLSEESTSEKDDKAEKASKEVAKDIEHDEGHKGKDDDKAEKAGEKVKKDIEYDDKKDKEEKKDKLDEWANEAGKKGTDASFEADIDFMMNVISGGLNKRKATGQTTIPVVASQLGRQVSRNTTDINESKMLNESVSDWKKLAGLK